MTDVCQPGACIENSQVCIVTELQRCSVYYAIVEHKESFTMREILTILYQVCLCATMFDVVR
jgi:hypothetical protein